MLTLARNCRSCGNRLEPIVDLGEVRLTGFPLPGEDDRPAAPLLLCACGTCKLVQLLHTVEREQLFETYWYQSGVNETMRAELHQIVDDAVARVGPFNSGDAVLDIGANDGTLLERYAHHDPHVLRIAYEPAHNLQRVVRPHCEVLVGGYFPEQYRAIAGLEGRVQVITSIAMIYAIDDLVPTLTAIAQLLADDGVWMVQFQDWAQMIKQRAFDNICHEHLCYFSLESFRALLPVYGLTVVDAEQRAINGGSLRLTIQHQGHDVSRHVAELLQAEDGCQDWASLEAFGAEVTETIRQIRGALTPWVTRGATIDLYGASTKANTLLQVCELDHTVIRQAWERSPEKVGRTTCGTRIPIVSEEAGRADPPDVLLLGIWQFRDAVLRREEAFLRDGGTIIVPLPYVDVIQQEAHRAHA